ncbi:LysR family transcriptional regulator [Eoetvoesiella caeni]
MRVRTDLNLLRLFVAIYDTGSVTAAATVLNMSQPAASAALARLRDSMSDVLFIRSLGGMEPTARAESIIHRTRELLAALDQEVLQKTEHDPASFTGIFSCCMTELGEVLILPTLLRHVRGASPQARLESVTLPADRVYEALRAGEVDMALGYYPNLQHPDVCRDLLFSHDLVVMVREGHPIKGECLTMEEFANAEQVAVRDGSRTQEMLDELLLRQKIRRNIVLRTSHYLSVSSIVAESDLITVVPRWLVERSTHGMNNRMVSLPFDFPEYGLEYFWHRKFDANPRSVWLRELVKSLFGSTHFNLLDTLPSTAQDESKKAK